MIQIPKTEMMQRIAQKATELVKKDGKVRIDGFGTLYYLADKNEWKFMPAIQLEQALRRGG